MMRKLIVVRAAEPAEHEPDPVVEYIAHHVRHAMNVEDHELLNEWLDILSEVAETRLRAALTVGWN